VAFCSFGLKQKLWGGGGDTFLFSKIEDEELRGVRCSYLGIWIVKNATVLRFLAKKSEGILSLFILAWQVIQWMQNPTELTTLREFPEWKEKCNVKVFHSHHPQYSMVLNISDIILCRSICSAVHVCDGTYVDNQLKLL
jgi:hypothetical protein